MAIANRESLLAFAVFVFFITQLVRLNFLHQKERGGGKRSNAS